MLLNIFFPEYRNKKYRSDSQFIYDYIIRWLLIIIIVSVIFMIINNLFYNTLDYEINTDIYNNPTVPTDVINLKTDNTQFLQSDNSKFLQPDLKSDMVQYITKSPALQKVNSIKPTSSINLKSLSINKQNDKRIFDGLNEILRNVKNTKFNNETDFNLTL